MRKIVPPFFKQIHFLIGHAMKKIAHYHKPAGFKVLKLRNQALQIFGVNVLWYWYARLSKMAGFSKMKIGSNQCIFFFPKNTTLA